MNAGASELILALDAGSTQFKAALYDEKLKGLAESAEPVTYLPAEKGLYELDPVSIQRMTYALIRRVCQDAGQPVQNIRRISITSQAQTFTVLSTDDTPLLPLISWMDRRAVSESATLTENLGADFHNHCGFPTPSAGLMLSKVAWLRASHPALLSRDNRIVPLPAYLSLCLGGPFITDRNWAALSGLYSLSENTWWSKANQLLGVLPAQLPDVVDPGQPLPIRTPSEALDLSPDCKIVFAGNDQTACAVGSGCASDEALATLGTALVAYRRAGVRPGPFHPNSAWGPYPGGGYYELAGGSDDGCTALDRARAKLLPGKTIEEFNRLATQAPPGSEGLLFMPERTYEDQPWRGNHDASLPAHCRAVFEGIGFRLKYLLETAMRIEGPPPCRRMRVGGGGSRSDPWLEIIADILEKPVARARGNGLFGAAIMASGQPATDSSATSDSWIDPKHAGVYSAGYASWTKCLMESSHGSTD